MLSDRLGKDVFEQAINPNERFPSPVADQPNGDWLRRTNTVGINVRTIRNFWNVVKYALTLPRHVSNVHLLPIWEPGVVASLYGMTSWQVNAEFFSSELAILWPNLDRVEHQLKVVVNLLHAMGKTVGMDVIPHCDRYSQIVLANPHHFEWLQRDGLNITNHRADLHTVIAEEILAWLASVGAADQRPDWPRSPDVFFSDDFPESERNLALFGPPQDYQVRLDRRSDLIDWLYIRGYEPVPATMAPPYRGIEVDPRPLAITNDRAGRIWRDYRIKAPQEMSRVFGPLTRYKLYERLDNNRDWQIDFDRPRQKVWAYVADNYRSICQEFSFDFMRGDMSHVQMRPEGVPAQPDDYYDFHCYVKQAVRAERPYFAYFSESFLTAPNFMSYGNEIDHLEASDSEVALGDLQSTALSDPAFSQRFRFYLDVAATRRVTPCFTIITADKDDPRFDKFYLSGNEARLFMGLFLTNLPSYFSLGFEQRDIHPRPVANEHYTKLYVFKFDEGPKATEGPYRWGENGQLFHRLTRIHLLAEQLLPLIEGADVHWLLPPDPTGGQRVIAWTQTDQPRFVFVVNLDHQATTTPIKVPTQAMEIGEAIFSTHRQTIPQAILTQHFLQIGPLEAGEGLCYQV